MDNFGITRKAPRKEELNIAPMMDMIFILLIFFIVTTSFTRETGLDISKPQAASAKELPKENILIGVTREGVIHIQESQVALTQLKSILTRLTSENPDRQVIIVADRGAAVATLVDIMDECNKAQVRKVSLASERE